MIALLDAGNTRLKWGLCPAHPAAVGAIDLLAEGWLDYSQLTSLAAQLRQAVPATHSACQLQRILISNVAGQDIANQLSAALSGCGIDLEWVRSEAECCGVRNLYDAPERLGVDRWAALIGARALHAGPCLVVTAGTATTVDVLAGDGSFQGGLILPGERLMRRALAGNTAQLPFAEGQFQRTPRNTADAIVSGCLLAQAGAIEHMYAQLQLPVDAPCLLNGGGAADIAPHLSVPYRSVNNLVLKGLARIAHAHCPPSAPSRL